MAGQTVAIVGAKSNTPVATNDKFRVTWVWTLGEFGSGAFFDSHRFDISVQEALPSNGFLPASAPAAAPGDAVIVYDVRLLSAWGAGGKTVADVIVALDKLPLLTDVALDVAKVEKLNPNATSAELAAGQAAAREQGNKETEKKREESGIPNPFDALNKFIDAIGAFTAVAVVGIAAFAAYSLTKR